MNQPLQVKICGLQAGDDLSFTDDPNVSYIGFIFVPASRRFIPPQVACNMVNAIERKCRSVGVFSGATLEDILSAVAASGIEIVQLHGQESPEMCRELQARGLTVWKALAVESNDVDLDRLKREIDEYIPVTDALLFDAKPAKDARVTGGHGQAFDWHVLEVIQSYLAGRRDWYVAGGITPDNVAQILSVSTSTGIDVSSGVEVDGRKEIGRIRNLLSNVSEKAVDR